MDAPGHNVTPLRVVQTPDELTIEQTADRLHCSYRQVLRLLAAGAFPSVKIGRHRRINAADVDAYVDHLRGT